MTVVINGTTGITSPGGDVSTSLTTGTLNATTENITTLAATNLSIGGTSLGAGNASIMKNRIINGSMVVSQYNAASSVTPSANGCVIDRFNYQASQTSKFTFQQNQNSVTPPTGFANYLGATVASSVSIATGDYFSLTQNIEGFNTADLGWGTSNAKTITVSFWVRSSLTGTFGVAFRNANADRNYQASYTINTANTWEYKTLTVVGDTTGTWEGATNAVGIRVTFGLSVGADYTAAAGSWGSGNKFGVTGNTSVVATAGATFYITGVQLEVGSSATGFEYRQYQQELTLCQRYYWRTTGGSGVQFAAIGSGYANTTSQATVVIPIPVTMRAIPTLNFGGTINVLPASATTAVTSIPQSYTGNGCVWVVFALSVASLTVGTGAVVYTQNASTNFLDASAEL